MNDAQRLEKHMEADADFQKQQKEFNEKVAKALFGDGDKEMGMAQQNYEMYTLLMQARGFGGVFGWLFGNLRNTLLMLVSIAAAIAIVKGWLKP